MTLSTFPISFDKEDQAVAEAKQWSERDKDHLFFVIFKTNGKYIVDIIGNPYSDEKVLQVYFQGELQP